MKKIVIRSDQIESNCGLISLLNELFPECEIIVSSDKVETFEEYQSENLPNTGVIETIKSKL